MVNSVNQSLNVSCLIFIVTQSCLTLTVPLPGSSVHGILQARIPGGWGESFPFPGNLSNPGIEAGSPAFAGRFFTI